MKQSELHRDIFEPGWREKEQAHYAKLIDAVPTVKQSLQVQTMTTQTAEQLADMLSYQCTCHEGYTSRGRTDPQCHACHVEPEASQAASMLRSQAAEIERLRSDTTVERLVDVVYKHWQDPRNHRPIEIRKDIRAALETGK